MTPRPRRGALVVAVLLAARKDAGGVVLALPKVREQREHVVEAPSPERPGTLEPELQVLLDRQRGEDLAVLGHVANAGMSDLVGAQPGDALPLEHDLANWLDQPHDGLARGGAAHAVPAEQAYDLAGLHLEVHALEDVALAVEGVKIAYGQHQATSAGAPR